MGARCHAGVALLPDPRGGSCANAEHARCRRTRAMPGGSRAPKGALPVRRNAKDVSRVVPATVNVWWLPYVIPDSMPPKEPAKRVMSRQRLAEGRRTPRKRVLPAEASAERKGTAGRSPTSASGRAVASSASKAVTAMAVAAAVADGNAA